MACIEVFGQDRVVGFLRRAIGKRKIASAYLFVGEPCVGRFTCALWLAQQLLCEGQKGCGNCRACKKVEALAHPDMHLVFPGGNGEGIRDVYLRERSYTKLLTGKPTISINDIRELRERIYLTAFEGGWKVVIIGGAEFMTQDAASALLKILEEPPGDTVFVLMAEAEEKLLPTILSRCHVLKFGPLSRDDIRKILTHKLYVREDEVEKWLGILEGSVLPFFEEGVLDIDGRLVRSAWDDDREMEKLLCVCAGGKEPRAVAEYVLREWYRFAREKALSGNVDDAYRDIRLIEDGFRLVRAHLSPCGILLLVRDGRCS